MRIRVWIPINHITERLLVVEEIGGKDMKIKLGDVCSGMGGNIGGHNFTNNSNVAVNMMANQWLTWFYGK